MRELPKYLYKYRSNDPDRLRNIVEGDRIYFSPPSKINDPFDCHVKFDNSGTKREWKKKFERLMKDRLPGVNYQTRKIMAAQWVREGRHKRLENFDDTERMDEIGIFSMAEHPDNLLMWAHYASDHKGVCLQYSAKSDCDVFGKAVPITYSAVYPQHRYVEVEVRDVILDYLETKSEHWSYEKEWRLFGHPKGHFSGPGEHSIPSALLVGIIFGCQVEEAFKNEVLEMAKNRTGQVQLYQAVMKDRQYGLDVIEV